MKSEKDDVKNCVDRISEVFNADERTLRQLINGIHDTQDIGLLFKRTRAALDYNQEQMSKLIGISTSYLSRIENGAFIPSSKILNDIVKVIESSQKKKIEDTIQAREEMTSDYKSEKLNTLIKEIIKNPKTFKFEKKPQSNRMRVPGNPSTALSFEIIEETETGEEIIITDEKTGEPKYFYDPNDVASYILKEEKYLISSIDVENSPVIIRVYSSENLRMDVKPSFLAKNNIDDINNYKFCFNHVQEEDFESLEAFLDTNYEYFIKKKTWKDELPQFCINGLKKGVFQGYFFSIRHKEEKNNNKTPIIVSYIDVKPIRLDGFSEIGIAVTEESFRSSGIMKCMMNFLFLKYFFTPFWSGTWSNNGGMLTVFGNHNFSPYYFKDEEEHRSCFVDERIDNKPIQQHCYSVYLQRPSTFDLCNFLK